MFGQRCRIRALLDWGSQMSLITKECAEFLCLKTKPIRTHISGISRSAHSIKTKIVAHISNETETFSHNLELRIIPKITGVIPSTKLDISNLTIPHDIKLADPNFYTPGKINILIGNELFFHILKEGRVQALNGNITLQNTEFGYLMTGVLPTVNNQSYCYLIKESSLDNAIKKFFELEFFPGDGKEVVKNEEEIFCEKHFNETYSRDKTGRYIVKLPMKDDAISMLGSSKEIAIKRLNTIWNRLDANKTMANLYKEFMNEYLSLNHMESVIPLDNCDTCYYIPHHAVYRSEKTSTRLRVVFDASCKSSSGYSLNSILLNGGTIQEEDLFSIVSRFRKHRFAFSADIKQMYRQILIHPSQRNLQRIVWKNQAARGLLFKCYRFVRLTYGTTRAPFLATRTLRAHWQLTNRTIFQGRLRSHLRIFIWMIS
ncbi:uncharacterized protein LOC118203667 [Stegodyphus dumicola]|uniref:uncharacterized protein LOC118203667 n=1 Tax=Stegodyphus dumicola TaxID=202533 RepID=UPI0015A7B3EA|nr:uncharacterized protein LOC118203667 [Stegodyphus dumicola]